MHTSERPGQLTLVDLLRTPVDRRLLLATATLAASIAILRPQAAGAVPGARQAWPSRPEVLISWPQRCPDSLTCDE